MYLYYDKMTGLVGGGNMAPRDPAAEATGFGANYAVLKVDSFSVPLGKIPYVVNGVLTFQSDAVSSAYASLRNSALSKVKTIALLSDQELKALFGG